MIDILLNHQEYEHLAAYYMDVEMDDSDIPGLGVVMEFQRHLAKLYGLTSWYNDKTKEEKRAAYWKNAFRLGIPRRASD